MTVEQKLVRLTGIVDALAGAVLVHDNQIEAHTEQIGALLKIADKNLKETTELKEGLLSLEDQLQAYLKRLPPQ